MDQTKRFLPWVVAVALFMEQLDSTIVNTSIPAMAASLGTSPLSLKAVAGSYIISLAVCLPLSGWLAQRFGTRKVFLSAIGLFTLSSVICGLAVSAPMLVAARVPQGMAAAMMMPVGRMAIVRTFPKAELLRAMNFVIVPALLGPLLGPTVGGLIVHGLSWRDIFFVNVPVGLVAWWFGHRHMPDYRGDTHPPLDLRGFVLFGGATATPMAVILALSLALGWFSSLQFSSMNSMAYADVAPADAAMAATIASTMQQLSFSFGLACGSLVAGFYLDRPGAANPHDPLAVAGALHHAFLVLSVLTVLSSLSFWSLHRGDGASVSGARHPTPT